MRSSAIPRNSSLDAGGKVLGEVRHPLNNSDFSSYLLQAQASKAKVIGLANASTDAVNAIKQGTEFGIVEGGQRMAALLMFIADVEALGLKSAQGLVLTESFYWDLNDKTRAWTKRFMAEMNGKVPTMGHAGAYAAALHYLKAVKEAAPRTRRPSPPRCARCRSTTCTTTTSASVPMAACCTRCI